MSAVLDDIATMARAKWIRLAQTELHSSRADYINNIQEVEGSGDERWIALLGVVPNMIEQGSAPWDMRDTLLTSSKAKTSASGSKYMSIPFRHGTPGTKSLVGTPMGVRYGPQGDASLAWAASGHFTGTRAEKIGKALYQAARQLKAKQRIGTDKKSGRTVIAKGRRHFLMPLLAPHHKTDIYAGMKRSSYKTPKKGAHTQYVTFRTISSATSIGWVHPGIQARHLHERVEEHVQKHVGAVIQLAISSAIGDGQ